MPGSLHALQVIGQQLLQVVTPGLSCCTSQSSWQHSSCGNDILSTDCDAAGDFELVAAAACAHHAQCCSWGCCLWCTCTCQLCWQWLHKTHGHGKSSRYKRASDQGSPQASQYLRVRSSAGSTTGSCSWTTTVGCVCTVHFHSWYLVHLRYAA